MVTIRRATTDDIAAMVALVNAAFDSEPFRTRPRTTEQDLPRIMRESVFLLAMQDGRIVGSLRIKLNGTSAYFGMLAVDPTLQRSGIGQALLAAAEDFCRASGCTEATLSTGDFNLRLVAYYGRLGYRETHREPAPPDAPFSRPFDIIHMAKQL